MRPRHYAADNVVIDSFMKVMIGGFNEAAALRRG